MLPKHIDYIIAFDIMGFSPVYTPDKSPKHSSHSQRTLWKNDTNERFLFHPSQSCENSRQLVKHMVGLGYEFRMFSDGSRWICSFAKEEIYHGISKNDNEAICYAALQAHNGNT